MNFRRNLVLGSALVIFSIGCGGNQPTREEFTRQKCARYGAAADLQIYNFTIAYDGQDRKADSITFDSMTLSARVVLEGYRDYLIRENDSLRQDPHDISDSLSQACQSILTKQIGKIDSVLELYK